LTAERGSAILNVQSKGRWRKPAEMMRIAA